MKWHPFHPPEDELRSFPLDFADRQLSERRQAYGRHLRWESLLLAAVAVLVIAAIAWLNLT